MADRTAIDRAAPIVRVPLIRRFRGQLQLQLMTLPGVLFLLIFAYLPMISLIIAFQDFKILMGYFASPFVGLKHFTWALTDPEFYPAFRNTVLLSLYGLVIGFPVPILLALLINEIPRTGFKRVVQTTSYLPHFISYVVTAYLFILLLDRRGIVNDVLVAVGLVDEPVLFWTKPEYWRLLATMVNVWKGMGWSAILYLAAIAGIDEQLYEAAIIDGAGRLRRAWRITLPNMTGIISVLLILSMGGLVRAGLDTSYLLGNLFTRETSYVLEYYVLEMGLELGRYSFATSVGLMQSLLAMILVVITNWLSGRISGRSLF